MKMGSATLSLASILRGLFLLSLTLPAAPANHSFEFNGFSHLSNLSLTGMASVTPEGLLKLSNATENLKGHAIHATPVPFRTPTSSNQVVSFSTTFVFAIRYTQMSGHGIVFLISPSKDFSTTNGGEYMGVFNTSDNGNATNHIVAVELDTVKNPEFMDIDTNHVGINVNGMESVAFHTAGYYKDGDSGTSFQNLSLISGDRMQVWVDYSGELTQMNVTLSQFKASKPTKPLVSYRVNLSDIFPQAGDMYVGLSSSTGAFLSTHYILGWAFRLAGEAKLDLSTLPTLPPLNNHSGGVLVIWLPVVSGAMVIALAGIAVFAVARRRRFSEVREDWEDEYGPNRFSYKLLFDATGGFRSRNLLGSGGFGSVYRGTLPTSKTEVAVKRISHDSRQGIREFVAEIVSLGRLHHRNLVRLHGYCRRKRELLLVYEYMPNGSLDRLLFSDQTSTTTASLSWKQRLHIIKGVASGILYLHEEWEKVVIHRDIKASNVLLEKNLDPRLGDFGLARLHDHGAELTTTRVVGTMGYLAPELGRTLKATKATDVFAFGAFVLEVATGRRPIDPRADEEEDVLLTDWVLEGWKRGDILWAADRRMSIAGDEGEVEMVLKLGLLCSHRSAAARPSVRDVVRFLEGDAVLPAMSPEFFEDGRGVGGAAVVSSLFSTVWNTESSVLTGR